MTYSSPGKTDGKPFTELYFEIHNEANGSSILTNSTTINSTKLFDFPLFLFSPRMEPYNFSIYGTSEDGEQTYSASTEIYYLPSRSYGSAVKIDNLYGGLYVQNVISFLGWRYQAFCI